MNRRERRRIAREAERARSHARGPPFPPAVVELDVTDWSPDRCAVCRLPRLDPWGFPTHVSLSDGTWIVTVSFIVGNESAEIDGHAFVEEAVA